jgi:dTDP-glucose pyrophosphorylase
MEIVHPEKLFSPLVLIPAAGFGTRVGSPPAKELLPHPQFPQKTFLDIALERINALNACPLVISREDKTTLNQNLLCRQISFLKIKSSTDWYDSIYQSRPWWQKKNLLLLPDTVFEPQNILEKLLSALETHELALSVFRVDDSSLWGGVNLDQALTISEKKPHYPYAWGHLAFHEKVGADLFSKLNQKQYFKYEGPYQALQLHYFKDVTR